MASLFLIGSTGRLGSTLMRLAKNKNVPVVVVDRRDFDFQQDGVILDVSLAEGTKNVCQKLIQIFNHRPSALKHIKGFVVGTTGHDQDTKNLLEQVSHVLPVCVVSNFSKGIFLFEQILGAKTKNGHTVLELAKKLGFDLSLQETHHTQKKDSPSGTALSLARAAEIPQDKITSFRQGDVVGDHTLLMQSQFEQLSITHQAHDRSLFASGALDLCQNIFHKNPKPGFLLKDDFL